MVAENSFLPGVTGDILFEFAETFRQLKPADWMKSVRDWASRTR
jgi:hypothetical protein